MGRQSKGEYFRASYRRYRGAERRTKQVILSEFCAHTGYHRKYAIRLLNGPRRAGVSAATPPPAGTPLRGSVAGDRAGDLGGGGLSLVGAAAGADP